MTEDEIKDKYERMARWYDLTDAFYEHLNVKKLRTRLGLKVKGKVLEVAVGTGKNLAHYPNDIDITAVDISPAMINQARLKASKLGMNVSFQIMNGEKLDFPDNSFDTVVSTLSACTLLKPEEVYRELARVCRKEGKILLIEHGRSSNLFLSWFQDAFAEFYYRSFACLWNRNPLDAIISAGLNISKCEKSLVGIFNLIEAQKG
jgi:ubiquinone/menaquinone biosynthesis C-methylase UbiE